MCLIVTSELKVAKKNILVYKMLYCLSDGRYKSEFYEFPYKPNELYLLDTPLKPQDSRIKNGFHSWKNIPYVSGSGRLRVVKFIIPKGASYYEGTQHDEKPGYVSNMIRMVGKPNLWDILTMYYRLLFTGYAKKR